MTIEYQIDENDFLTHQLYIASKSDRIKKKRKRNKVIVPLFYAAFGVFNFYRNMTLLAVVFFVVGILWFFIYPLWEKRRYIKHYKGFIKENFKDSLGASISLELNNDFIKANDSGSESKVLTTEVVQIIEIPSIILIRLKGSQSFILPKHKIANIENVKDRLKELAEYLNIKYVLEEKWEWK